MINFQFPQSLNKKLFFKLVDYLVAFQSQHEQVLHAVFPDILTYGELASRTIGTGAYTASGSVITDDVPADAVAFGRARQENKPGYAPKLREKALAKKAAKGK